MACCYLIQSHTQPGQVLRLVETIKQSSPNARVLVVHDATGCALDPAPFEKYDHVKVIAQKVRVARGEMSVLTPLFTGLEELLGREGGRPRWDFDWLVYLSGQDYPTRPVRGIEESLATSGVDGFLSHWGIEPGAERNPWRSGQGRTGYLAQYRRFPDWTLGLLKGVRFLGKVSPLRFHLHYGPFVGWQPRTAPFSESFRCYGGWQWWTLSRAAVEHFWDFFRSRPEVIDWFRHTVCPCESLVPTVVANSGRFAIHPDNRRYADFAGSRDGRPRTLGASDFATITGGRYDFARKLDLAKSPEILDLLDAEVLGAR